VRVLHVVPSLAPESGGPARSVPALCEALGNAGLDCTLYYFRQAGSQTTLPGGESSFLSRPYSPLSCTRQVPTLKFAAEFRRDVESASLAHLYSFWNPVVSLAALICRSADVPYIVSPRGMLQNGALERKSILKTVAHRLWEARTIAGASALHFLSEGEASESARIAGQVPSFVVPSGIDDYELTRGRDRSAFLCKYPSLRGRRYMAFVGRLHAVKRLDLQLQAMRILRDRLPDLSWVLIGPDEGEWNSLEEGARTLGLLDRVIWAGFVAGPERLDALAGASVFVLSSKHEAHSMAMNEALALGVPVVLTDTVKFAAVSEYGAGEVVPSSPEAIAKAVGDILENGVRAGQMSVAARKLAAERLSWPKVAQQLIGHYEEVLAGRRLGSSAQDPRKGTS